jgi:adenosylmethionine-8-amino-7-oxononanoate aminotransferase
MASMREAAPRLFPHNSELPIAVRGKGIRIWDEGGGEYLDACSGAISVISIGHGVDEVADAMAEQARTLAYVHSTQFGHAGSRELATRIGELAPGSLNRAVFYSGGS